MGHIEPLHHQSVSLFWDQSALSASCVCSELHHLIEFMRKKLFIVWMYFPLFVFVRVFGGSNFLYCHVLSAVFHDFFKFVQSVVLHK